MSKRARVLQVIHVGGYHHGFILAIGATAKQILSKINREQHPRFRHKCTAECYPDDGLTLSIQEHGRTTRGDCGNVIVIFRDAVLRPSTLGYITHEAFHVLFNLMECVHMPLAEASEEAWAYALEDIVTRIVRAVQR